MELRDANGKLMGTIKKLSNGNVEARNANGKLCGIYETKTGITRDANGKSVGKGDHLARLIQP